MAQLTWQEQDARQFWRLPKGQHRGPNGEVRRLVYYSLYLPPAEPRPDLLRQLLTSVQSLREHNRTVPVLLFLHGSAPPELSPALAPYGVDILFQGDYAARLARLCPSGWPVLVHYPLLHKFLNFAALTTLAPRQVLYLDCDTLFFADVDRLFDAYVHAHCHAREEPTCRRSHYGYDPAYLDETVLASNAATEGLRPAPPFNLGVVLFNHGITRILAGLERDVVSYAWRLLVWLALHPDPERTARYGEGTAVRLLRQQLARFVGAEAARTALPYASANEWILDQVALWLALGRLQGLTYADFSRCNVLQNGEFLSHPVPRPEWVVCHYFSQNTARLEAWLRSPALAVQP